MHRFPVAFFVVALVLLFYVSLDSCASYVEVWIGMLAPQVRFPCRRQSDNHACNGTHTASCLYYCVSYHLRVLSILQIVMTTTSILGCFTYMVGAMLSCK